MTLREYLIDNENKMVVKDINKIGTMAELIKLISDSAEKLHERYFICDIPKIVKQKYDERSINDRGIMSLYSELKSCTFDFNSIVGYAMFEHDYSYDIQFIAINKSVDRSYYPRIHLLSFPRNSYIWDIDMDNCKDGILTEPHVYKALDKELKIKLDIICKDILHSLTNEKQKVASYLHNYI